MYISVNSVKAYLATIYQKIGITKRHGLKILRKLLAILLLKWRGDILLWQAV